MPQAYNPPGVSIEENFNTVVTPTLAVPALVCLVGVSQGYQTRTDQFTLSGTTPVPLPGLPDGSTLQDILSVKDSLNPSNGASDGSGYIKNTNYTFSSSTIINEVQTITITGTPAGGNFKLSFGINTTGNIAYNASSATVQTALQGLDSIGSGNATVSGSAGGPYTVTFVGELAATDVDLIIADPTGLTGGTSPNLTVVESTKGINSKGTITRVGSGIVDGTLVNVTYKFLANDYWDSIRLFDQGSVESRFGSALDSTGTVINSPVSYASQLAFENGVGSVVIQPLFVRASPGDSTSAQSQPNTTQAATPSTWVDTLYNLRSNEDVNVIVPVVGQSQPHITDSVELQIFQAVQDHAYFMATENQFIISIFGEDSSESNTVAQKATLRSHGNTLRSRYGQAVAEQTVLLNTAKFPRNLPLVNRTISLGGQYAAAAISGMLAAYPVSSSLTRKIVSGLNSVDDFRSLSDKNTDAGSGLLVLETKNGNVVIRHAITLDQRSAAKRELSVVRAKHRMIESIRDTIDNQIIGQILADSNATTTVSATVVSVLEQLRAAKDLVDYSAVQSRLLSLDPTTIEVRFSYRPAFPLNYVNIIFSLDLTTGILTDTTNGA